MAYERHVVHRYSPSEVVPLGQARQDQFEGLAALVSGFGLKPAGEPKGVSSPHGDGLIITSQVYAADGVVAKITAGGNTSTVVLYGPEGGSAAEYADRVADSLGVTVESAKPGPIEEICIDDPQGNFQSTLNEHLG